MKKIIMIIICLLLLSGCENKDDSTKIIKDKVDPIKEEEVYKDLNDTPIGIYKLNGNKLTRLDTITKTLNVEEDIDTFQIYFSNDKEINLNKGFAESYYEEYKKYNVKVGFNIKFKLNNGESISYNILSPNDTFNEWEYLMNYLYDDYANRGNSFYSHIEKDQYNENTLFTSIKLQSSYKCKDIASKIELKVFTYDDAEDIENNDYKGNSQHILNICLTGIQC